MLGMRRRPARVLIVSSILILLAGAVFAGIIDDVLNWDPGAGFHGANNDPADGQPYSPPNQAPTGTSSDNWASVQQPAPTPCQFAIALQGDWTLQKADGEEVAIDYSWSVMVRSVAIEIFAQADGWDDTESGGDTAQGVKSVGNTVSKIVIFKGGPCNATFTAEFYPEFRVRIMGGGDVEGQGKGMMYGQMMDLTFPNPVAVGDTTKKSGVRGEGQPEGTTEADVTIDLPLPGGGSYSFSYKRTTTVYTSVIPDEENHYYAINTPQPVRALTSGETVTMISNATGRVYAEAAPEGDTDSTEAAVGLHLGRSNPMLTVYLNCVETPGVAGCPQSTTLKYGD